MLFFNSFLQLVYACVKNKLVFSIIWTQVFTGCSCMLLILFVRSLSLSPSELMGTPGRSGGVAQGGGWRWPGRGAGGSEPLSRAVTHRSATSLLATRAAGSCRSQTPCSTKNALGASTATPASRSAQRTHLKKRSFVLGTPWGCRLALLPGEGANFLVCAAPSGERKGQP